MRYTTHGGSVERFGFHRPARRAWSGFLEDVNLSIKQGEAVPEAVILSVIELLDKREPHPEGERLVDDLTERQEAVEQWLSRRAEGSRRHEQWLRAVKRQALPDKGEHPTPRGSRTRRGTTRL